MPDCRGFTLVELIGIIAIAGILLALAAPRFFSAGTFSARGYQDAAAGFLRYAQKLAVARHATLHMLADADGLTLCAGASVPCAVADQLPGPDGQSPYRIQLPSGLAQHASAASLGFDAQGRPDSGFSLDISGAGALTLTVEAETGYVH